jgi:glyoxylase-like metal-dependent hydrolase (beta-lactamase superfamily II)
MGHGEQAIDADGNRRRAMSTEATPQTTARALIFTSPAHDLVAARGSFSPTTSTLLVGQSESVLVDAQYIDSDIAALGDLIESTGRRLTTIYVTHAHADHYLGMGALLERFPGARPLATPGVVEAIKATLDLQQRSGRRCSAMPRSNRRSCPEPTAGDVIDLEGAELRVIEVGQGDIRPSTVPHVPGIDTVVAGDVIYNQIHAMLGLNGPDEWRDWIASIEQVERLRPATIVAGHKQPEASDHAVEQMIDGTRSYISDFAEAAQSAKDADQGRARRVATQQQWAGLRGVPWTCGMLNASSSMSLPRRLRRDGPR